MIPDPDKGEIFFTEKDGKPLLVYPEAAGIIAIEDGKLLMVRQYRVGSGRLSLEIPAGKKKKNESIEQCAYRELREETGYHAQAMKFLISYYPAIGISTEKLTIFEAENLIAGEPSPDADEELTLEKVPVAELRNLVHRGEIVDSKTIIAALLLNK